MKGEGEESGKEKEEESVRNEKVRGEIFVISYVVIIIAAARRETEREFISWRKVRVASRCKLRILFSLPNSAQESRIQFVTI